MSDQSMEPSEEVDERQLELARAEGEAYQDALEYMATEVAHAGDKRQVDDYVIGYAIEEAEGMYEARPEGQLEWVEPESENCHLEVAVASAADGRFLPYLDVEAKLIAEDGTTVGPHEIPFIWHPGLYHYGKNLEVPGEGSYTVRIEVAPPEFRRHDETNGDRFVDGIEVEFEGVEIETGQG
jgi:uncharacterized protein involved in high-affinity Fe2+ transport